MLRSGMKKVIAMMLVVIMMVTNTPFVAVAANDNTHGDYLFETIVDDGSYTKLKITNTVTGKVEWVEGYNYEDGSSHYIASSDDITYIIDADTEKISVLLDGVIINEISLASEMPDSIIMPSAYEAWSGWTTEYSSSNIVVGNMSAVVAVVAAIMKLSLRANIVVAIATWLVSNAVPQTYYSISTRTRYDWSLYKMQQEIKTTFYTDSSYTTSIGSDTRTVTTSLQSR